MSVEPATGPSGPPPVRDRPQDRAGLAVYHRAPTEPSERPGGAPRVVYVHGAMDRAASFIRTVRRRPGLDAVRYDRRGYGRSGGIGVAATMDDSVDDLLTVLDGRPAVVVGHSLGGVVAIAAAARAPDLIPAVVAFEAPLWTRDAAEPVAERDRSDAEAWADPEQAAERFMRRMIGDAAWDALPASTRATRRAEGPALVADIAAIRTTPIGELAAGLTVPVVAGRGTTSSDRHRSGAARLAEQDARRTLVTIEGAGHDAHRTHPEEFAELVDLAIGLAAR